MIVIPEAAHVTRKTQPTRCPNHTESSRKLIWATRRPPSDKQTMRETRVSVFITTFKTWLHLHLSHPIRLDETSIRSQPQHMAARAVPKPQPCSAKASLGEAGAWGLTQHLGLQSGRNSQPTEQTNTLINSHAAGRLAAVSFQRIHYWAVKIVQINKPYCLQNTLSTLTVATSSRTLIIKKQNTRVELLPLFGLHNCTLTEKIICR